MHCIFQKIHCRFSAPQALPVGLHRVFCRVSFFCELPWSNAKNLSSFYTLLGSLTLSWVYWASRWMDVPTHFRCKCDCIFACNSTIFWVCLCWLSSSSCFRFFQVLLLCILNADMQNPFCCWEPILQRFSSKLEAPALCISFSLALFVFIIANDSDEVSSVTGDQEFGDTGLVNLEICFPVLLVLECIVHWFEDAENWSTTCLKSAWIHTEVMCTRSRVFYCGWVLGVVECHLAEYSFATGKWEDPNQLKLARVNPAAVSALVIWSPLMMDLWMNPNWVDTGLHIVNPLNPVSMNLGQ